MTTRSQVLLLNSAGRLKNPTKLDSNKHESLTVDPTSPVCLHIYVLSHIIYGWNIIGCEVKPQINNFEKGEEGSLA